MASQSHEPSAGDFRRAAALMTHRASTNADDVNEGVRAILEEAVAHGRLTRLLLALDEAYRIWLDKVGAAPREAVDYFVDHTASQHEDPYTRRAAAAIQAIRRDDVNALNALLIEVNAENGGPRLVGAVSDIYTTAIPELSTPEVISDLQAWTLEIACYDHEE
ncbi:hypothetical protein [Mycobacterium sp. SMC-4]|uniref:hypothetical protein n=1 Tax=Mycobacterium sp. SMC-4 TaxID=2857059 RepID=UPI003CFD0B62